jgi:hypothetical protein
MDKLVKLLIARSKDRAETSDLLVAIRLFANVDRLGERPTLKL